MMDEIKVSICCTVYNHEKYLRKCLDGFVMQKTDFAYEIIIHDDASTDKSAEIIREYEKKYPDIFRPIYQTENQYSQGIRVSEKYIFPIAKGKYIAFCEGDDYWCDEKKLQKQFEQMEKNPNAVLCTGKVRCISEDGRELKECFPSKEIDSGIISSDSMMKLMVENNSYPFHTSSFFYRKEIKMQMIKEKPKFALASNAGDVPLMLYMAMKGDIIYIDSILSHYRVNSIGSWNARTRSSLENQIMQCEVGIATYTLFNVYSKRRYKNEVRKLVELQEYHIYQFEKNYKKLCEKRYRWILNNESFKQRIFYLMSAHFPCFGKMYEKIKS